MNQKHVEITPELYSEMLDEVIRLKKVNAELLAALKAASHVMHCGFEYQRVLEAIREAERHGN